MNPLIAKAAASAMVAAGGAALWVLWSAKRRRTAMRDLRTQLKTWESEGGKLAAAPAPAPSAER